MATIYPHSLRIAHPSIFSDDVARVLLLRTHSLGESLTTPFNEHVAPFFDTVTWLSYRAAGGRLAEIPRTFTEAAFVPFLIALGLLTLFAKRELGSYPAAGVVVATFALAPIHVVETVWWYSGSNHMWAVDWTLVALIGAGRGGRIGLAMAAIGSALAPACSLMGLLAVPASALFALGKRGKKGVGVVPSAAAGLGVYFAFGAAVGLIGALLHGRRYPADPPFGLMVAGEVPAAVLIPALIGLEDLSRWFARGWLIAATLGLNLGAMAWAVRSRSRALILLGVFLILGGYVLIFPFRTAGGREMMVHSARYHLYPHLGLSILVATALRRPLGGPKGEVLAMAMWAALVALHLPKMIAESSFYDYPNQSQTLVALERVRRICRAEGITSGQAIAALEPIRPHWMPLDAPGANVAPLIGFIPGPSRVPDDEVRDRLLTKLAFEDKEGLFGGMDVGPYLVAFESLTTDPPLPTRREGSLRIRPDGPDNAFLTEGWPSYLEYRVDAPPAEVAASRWLALAVMANEGGVEVWWDDGSGHWTEGRSLLWTIDPAKPRGRIWAVPLDRLPHWDGERVKRLRILFRYPERVFAQPPRLLR